METGHSDVTSEGVRVRVAAKYLPSQSDPDQGQYVFAYRVLIQNEGTARARLVSRHWIVRDAHNERRDVRGPGVVGAHPDLAPGEQFEYESGCVLSTSWGTMEGSYRMQREDGSQFEATIGRFFLAPTVAPVELLRTADK